MKPASWGWNKAQLVLERHGLGLEYCESFFGCTGYRLLRRMVFRRSMFWVSVTIPRSPYGGRVDSSSRFVPGASAPRSGVYRVFHYAHRIPHLVTITAGTVFPECKRCAEKVRFVPMVAAEPIKMDADFIDQDFAA